MGDVAGVHRIRGDNNDAMPVQHCGSLDDAVALLAGPAPVRARHAAPLFHLGLGARQRGGARRGRGAVCAFHGPRGVRAPRHDAHRRRGDRGRTSRTGPASPRLLLPGGRRTFSVACLTSFADGSADAAIRRAPRGAGVQLARFFVEALKFRRRFCAYTLEHASPRGSSTSSHVVGHEPEGEHHEK